MVPGMPHAWMIEVATIRVGEPTIVRTDRSTSVASNNLIAARTRISFKWNEVLGIQHLASRVAVNAPPPKEGVSLAEFNFDSEIDTTGWFVGPLRSDR